MRTRDGHPVPRLVRHEGRGHPSVRHRRPWCCVPVNVTWPVAPNPIDNYNRDVVPAARLEGELDQLSCRLLGVGIAQQTGRDLPVGHLGREAVRAHKEALTVDWRKNPGVGLGSRIGAQRTGDHVAPAVCASFVPGQLPGHDQFLYLGMVNRKLGETTFTQVVDAGVAHVERHPVLGSPGPDRGEPAQGRAHARILRIVPRGPHDGGVGRHDCLHCILTCNRSLPGKVHKSIDGDPAGHVAGRVAAHAVSHDEERWFGQEGILVDGPQAAAISHGPPSADAHAGAGRVAPRWPPANPGSQVSIARVCHLVPAGAAQLSAVDPSRQSSSTTGWSWPRAKARVAADGRGRLDPNRETSSRCCGWCSPRYSVGSIRRMS